MKHKSVLLYINEEGAFTEFAKYELWPDFKPTLVPVVPSKAIYHVPIANIAGCGTVEIPLVK
jgi:hypothetical protein